MALKQIPNLPPVLGLVGNEQIELVQAGVSSRAAVSQIEDWLRSRPTPPGRVNIHVGPTPPVPATAGQLWFYTEDVPGGGALYVYYNDGNSLQWVVANQGVAGPVGPVGPQGVPGPVGPPMSEVDLAALGVLSNGFDMTALLNSIFATYGGVAYRLNKVGAGSVVTTGTVNLPNGGYMTIANDVVWEAADLARIGKFVTLGRQAMRPLGGQVEAPLEVQNSTGALQLAVSAQGKMAGPNADIALGLLSTATTVAHVVQAVSQLLTISAVPYQAAFNFLGGALPGGAALTRASVGWAFNSAGVLTSSAIDAPRFAYDPTTLTPRGLHNEPAITNLNRNASCLGTVPGTPGTTPTFSSVTSSANGLTRTVVGGGTEDGIPYWDVRYAGTPTGGTSATIRAEASSTVPAVEGETWLALINYRLVGGSMTNLGARIVLAYRNAGGSGLSGPASTVVVPTSAALRTQSGSMSWTAPATTAWVDSDIRIDWTVGNPIDITLRVGAPQMIKASVPHSRILSTSAALTRAADVVTLTVPNGTYSVDIVRETGLTALTGVVVGAGTYVVPTDPGPLQKVVFR